MQTMERKKRWREIKSSSVEDMELLRTLLGKWTNIDAASWLGCKGTIRIVLTIDGDPSALDLFEPGDIREAIRLAVVPDTNIEAKADAEGWEDCGICEGRHPKGYAGDCRNDAMRAS